MKWTEGLTWAGKRLTGPAREPTRPPARFELPGTVYAIGDVHGCDRLLHRIVQKIFRDAVRRRVPWPVPIVLLGDCIDRGPDSASVIRTIRRLADHPRVDLTYLKGNHEAMLLRFMVDPAQGRRWIATGGRATLESYCVEVPCQRMIPEDTLLRIRDTFRDRMGGDYGFIRDTCRLTHQVGNVIFCHAALDPSRRPENQSADIVLWGDDQFIHYGGPEGVWTIHGHTITGKPEVVGNRIGIDTGAYRTGRLTAVRISAAGVRAFQVEIPPAREMMGPPEAERAPEATAPPPPAAP